ncbi:hypothetical protein ACFOW1_01610 [Parasediminibacterium paludis]|uniref:Uncharacterized protein n=1 Tax=Parasediminibacterium paludis TaxID=908966 RepID=A0ABV8PRS2_9BACT
MITTIAYKHKQYKVQLPESWNECSAKQLVQLAALFNSGVETDVAVIKALRILLGKNVFAFAFIPADVKYRLISSIAWVFKSNGLTVNVLPKYNGLYGPKSELSNTIFKEIHACEMYYRMHLDKVPDALDKLIAVLYREKKLFYNTKIDAAGDVRKAYNSNTVEHRAKQIAKWPQPVKDAILLFYDGCREHFIASNPAVFSKDGGETESEQFHGFFLMMRNLAADGKFGTFDKVENLPFYTALYEASFLVNEAAQAAQQLEHE